MPPADSFIIFGSISQEGQILWVSPSVYDILGYEPEELIGIPGYNIVCPDDQTDLRDFRKEYFVNDLVASQIVIRFTAKDGRSFPGMGLVSICYDFTVAIVTVLDSGAEACKSEHRKVG
jgi:PAS domain S-box-containing protein